MEIVDDFTLLIRSFRIFAPELFNCHFHELLEVLDLALMDEHVIRSDTCLSRVREFSPAHFVNSVLKVSGLGHDTRTLTTKLQNTVRQIFSSGLRNNFAHESATGEADHI